MSKPKLDAQMRSDLIAQPDVILEDKDLMQALIAANDRATGANVVDLRGVAMDRLETRMNRLEDTHRNVIAAAYENLAGTNQVHRAILKMLDPMEFEAFLKSLSGEITTILRVDHVRLVLETKQSEFSAALDKLDDVLTVAPPNFIAHYLNSDQDPRPVTLRQSNGSDEGIFGDAAQFIHSEACLLLDLGPDSLPGMLILGSEDPHQFTPQHGTDLLAFFAGVFERMMRRWLA